MKKYEKLVVPKDSAWTRKTWRKYAPIWVLDIVDGVANIFKWLPTIYKDRNWDDYYVLEILQKKIEFQRAYLIHANRHAGIENCNFWMTTVLNLLERENTEYYYIEYLNSFESELTFNKTEEDTYKVDVHILSERYSEYTNKYARVARKLLKEHPKFQGEVKKDKLCFEISLYNQKRCRHLLFKILEEKGDAWWD